MARPTRARSTWDPVTNPFDAKRVANDLRLEAQGRELGAAGVPLPSDEVLSGPENAALHAVEQALADYVESYQLRHKALQAQLSRTDLSARIAKAAASADQFDRQASGLLTEDADELRRLEEMARSRREALDRFREQHRRTELPHYPERGKRFFKFALAVFLVVIEAGLNSSFFAQGLGGGLIAGIFQAGAFSLINVVGSLLMGLLIVRYVNHVQWPQRMVGLVGAGGLVCGIVALALGVSHYRDALFVSAENAGALAKQTFLENPLALAEPASWLLFALSLAFGFVAAWDGYSLDDPYPGYGRAHRKAAAAASEYGDAISALRAELASYRRDLLSRLEEAQRACESSIVDLKGAIDDKKRLRDEMPNRIWSLQSALAHLIGTFRTENKVGRQGKRCPDYFNSTPQLGSPTLPDFSTEADVALLARQEALAAEFLQAQAAIRARIQSAFNARYNSLQTVDELFETARPQVGDPGRLRVVQDDATASAGLATIVPLRSAGAEGVAGT